MKHLRIYYKHHTNFSHDTKRFKITKGARDFPAELSEAEATALLTKELGDRAHSFHPSWRDFAEVAGSVVVDDERPAPDVEFWTAQEQPLFNGELAKASLMDSPRLEAQKARRDRRAGITA